MTYQETLYALYKETEKTTIFAMPSYGDGTIGIGFRRAFGMTVVAKSVRGHEFAYNPRSAHAVAERKAKAICDKLNELKYLLDNENEVWYVHEVDQYDAAYVYAEEQRFTWGKRGLIRMFSR